MRKRRVSYNKFGILRKEPVNHCDSVEASLLHQEAWQHGHRVRNHAFSQQLYFCAPILRPPVPIEEPPISFNFLQ